MLRNAMVAGSVLAITRDGRYGLVAALFVLALPGSICRTENCQQHLAIPKIAGCAVLVLPGSTCHTENCRQHLQMKSRDLL